MRSLLLTAAFLSATASAPLPGLPELPRGRCVLDETGSLRPSTLDTLQRLCAGLDRIGKGQLVVVVVANLHGRYDIGDLALDLFRQIRLGHRDRDDGVIVVLKYGPPGSNAIRVTIGYGLEGGMTDERLRSLLDEVAFPRLRQRDPDGALVALSERLSSTVLEEEESGRVERHAEQRRLEREREHPSNPVSPR
jgi:uncharacterized membrane protein YgcG